MDDLPTIISHWEQHPRDCFALSTVVRTAGSTYRKPGARMLVSKDGAIVGNVSGGALDQRLAVHAKSVLRSLRSVLVSFDTSRVGGWGGSMDILIEPILPLDGEGFFSIVRDCLSRRLSLVASTVFEADGLLEDWLGSYPLVAEDGARFGARELPAAIVVDGKAHLRMNRALERHYELEAGSASVLLHTIAPPTRLYICGAGPDVAPLASFASQLHWEVIVAKHPSEDPPTLPPACKLLDIAPEELAMEIRPDSRTACVIMTHQFGRDLSWLSAMLPLKLPYVGLPGSTARRQQLLGHIMDAPRDLFDWAMFDSLHGPVGLDIGADGPEEIAMATVSEIKAVLSGHSGGFLRDRAATRRHRNDLTLAN